MNVILTTWDMVEEMVTVVVAAAAAAAVEAAVAIDHMVSFVNKHFH